MIDQSKNNTSTLSNTEIDMTRREKLKKVAAVAVAYYLEQKQKTNMTSMNGGANKRWVSTRQAINMRERTMIQQRGRMASTRTLFRRSDTAIAS